LALGPVPATEKALERAGLTLDELGLFELNEPFAVQVLSWCDGVGVDPEDERLHPYGRAIHCGRAAHPVRRRNRLWPPAGRDRRATARAARLRVPGTSGRPLRADRALRRD